MTIVAKAKYRYSSAATPSRNMTTPLAKKPEDTYYLTPCAVSLTRGKFTRLKSKMTRPLSIIVVVGSLPFTCDEHWDNLKRLQSGNQVLGGVSHPWSAIR